MTIDVTPTTPGTLLNPAAGAGNVCKVDPDSLLTEANEGNNDCSDTVTVTASGTIVVHKEEAGSLANQPGMELRLRAAPRSPNSPDHGCGPGFLHGPRHGHLHRHGAEPEVSPPAQAVAGSFVTTHGTATNPTDVGQSHGSLSVVAGGTTHVHFKNTACPGTIAISKSSFPQDAVAAGGKATWTIVTATVDINPDHLADDFRHAAGVSRLGAWDHG
ncbi:MAG: hypothetical protein IPN07_09315 [Dehalococcoidia bacterium]|nr:hypothetical protein [Dehalococcoidia bacterium]